MPGSESFVEIQAYLRFINTTFKTVSTIDVGRIYTYQYLFMRNPDFNKLPRQVVRFYDLFPATFIFKINRRKNAFWGLNFHHLPLKARQLWLDKVSGILPINPTEQNTRIMAFGSDGSNYLKRLFLKSQFAFRQYNMKRVTGLKIIPIKYWHELFAWHARSYFSATLPDISSNYAVYTPPSIK